MSTRRVKYLGMLLVFAMTVVMSAPDVYAKWGRGKGKSYGRSKGAAICGMKRGRWGHGNSGKKVSMHGMFFKKMHFILLNKEELKLTDDQGKSIKAIKTAAKKVAIRQKAEMEIVSIDIRSKMHEDEINTTDINALLDKKFEIKKTLEKQMLDSYAKLKGVLSSKQWAKLKSIYHKSKKKK